MVTGGASPLPRALHSPGGLLLAAGVLEGGVAGGVVPGVCARELVVELGHVGHDEELVGALAPHHVVHVQQLRDPQLVLRQTEGEEAVPGLRRSDRTKTGLYFVRKVCIITTKRYCF